MANWYCADPKRNVWQRNLDDSTSEFASMTEVGGGRYRLGHAVITKGDVREYRPYLIENYLLDPSETDHALYAFCMYDCMTSTFLVGEPTDAMIVENLLENIVGRSIYRV